MAFGGITVSGGLAGLNVGSVAAADLAAATVLTVTAPAGSTVVVNLRGAPVRMVGMGIALVGVDDQHVLYNVCGSSTVDLQGVGVPGTVLAPASHVRFDNGSLDGQLVAWRVSGNGEPHHAPFEGDLPCVYCGDGVVGVGEECDDGDLADGDGCSARCTVERCGDGVLQPGEQCDDGGVVAGDGCSADCRVESWGTCGDGVVDDDEQCDDGNTVGGDGCSPTCFSERCVEDWGRAGFFNVFSRTTYTGGRHVGGAVAAAERVQMTGFAVGWQTPGSVSAVSDVLELDYGTLYGDAWYGSALLTSDVSALQFAAGGFRVGSPLDFGQAGARAAQFSAVLGLIGDTGTVTSAWGALNLIGGRPDVNVFSVQAADLAAAHTLRLRVPAGAAAVINVRGGAPSMVNMGFQLEGATAARTVYNFVDATQVTMSGIGLEGSVLAPHAAVAFSNGSMLGTLAAWQVSGDAELYHRPLRYQVDCAWWEVMRRRRIAAGNWPW